MNDLGFVWDAQEAAWNRPIEDLRKFRSENGHCHAPLKHKKFPKLGLWVKEQRRRHTLMKRGKQSHKNEERVKASIKSVFCWDTHETSWMERLREQPAEFKERYGTCMVPTTFSDNPRLGSWVHSWVHYQRRQYKKFKEGKSD